MTTLLEIEDFVVIGVMLAVSASIGLFFRFTGGRQKTTQEFLMAGKNMHIVPVAFSLMATYMSAISLLGVPSEVYMYGSQFILWSIGAPLGGVVAAYGLLPIFFDMDVATAYEYLEKRFGKITRTIASFLFTVQMILYMAVVLYAPSLALNAVTGLSTWTSVILLSVVCTFYCSLGGLKAVLWTDVFQSLLMYFTIITVAVAVFVTMGFSEVWNVAQEGGRLIFLNMSPDLTERYTFWNAIFSGILFSFHTFGTNQAQIQRMMSVGDLGKAQKALLWSLPLILIYNIFNFLDGVVIYSMFHDCDPMQNPATKLSSPDQLMPYTIVKLFRNWPGMSGLCIAGVFSASLSTISSAVNSLTAVTMEDFIRPFCSCTSLTESRAAVFAKFLAVGYGLFTFLLTFIVANFRGVIEASNILFGMVGGPVLGVFLLGMFSKTANEKGTLIGLFSGLVINAWLGFGSYIAKPHVEPLPQSISGCASILNSTFSNASALLNPEALTLSNVDSYEENYILPVYRISFVWFPFVGCLVVLIVGYATSFLLNFCTDAPEVDPRALSPFVRKLFAKSEKTKELKNGGAINSEIEMSMKKTNEIQAIETVIVRES